MYMQDFLYARSPVTCYTMVAHDIHDAMVAEIMWPLPNNFVLQTTLCYAFKL